MTKYRGHHPTDGDTVETMCWCNTSTVWVPVEDVRQGIPRPCGLEGCVSALVAGHRQARSAE